jgi:hypothetical protein
MTYSTVKQKQLIISHMVQKDETSPWSATINRASPFYGSSARLVSWPWPPQFHIHSYQKYQTPVTSLFHKKPIMTWLRLVAGLPTQRSGFNSTQAHPEYVVDKVATKRGFLRVLWTSLRNYHSTNTPCSLIYHWRYTILATDTVIE